MDDGHPEPAYKRDLLERAKEAGEPVTEVDREQHHFHVHAINEDDGLAYRATIRYDARADSAPSVQFARCHWDGDHATLRKWTSLATGSLSGPQRLPAWESLFAVFDAALGAYFGALEDD